jgi:hypothetical protein
MDLSSSEIGSRLAAQRRQVESECAVCGRGFVGTTRRRYCSAACSQRAHYARNAEQERAERRERYRSRRMAKLRILLAYADAYEAAGDGPVCIDLASLVGGDDEIRAILEVVWPLVIDGRWHRVSVIANNPNVSAAIPPDLARRALREAGERDGDAGDERTARMAVISAVFDGLGLERRGRDQHRQYRLPRRPDHPTRSGDPEGSVDHGATGEEPAM